MRNLIATSPKTTIEHIGMANYNNYCGFLASPRNGNHPRKAAEIGACWAMDNDAFSGFDSQRFLSALHKYQHTPNCVFVVSPDRVGNARQTLAYFCLWQPIIAAMGYPVAFALQNGMQHETLPWNYLDAVFIGGDTLFKYTPYVRDIAQEAKRQGKWLHMGRVNSTQRIRHCQAIGCDSFDGTGYAIEPRRALNELHHWKSPLTLPVQYTLLSV